MGSYSSSPSRTSSRTPARLGRRSIQALLVLATLLVDPGQVFAQQIIEAQIGKEVSVEIPAKGLTLFRTEGGKLLKLRSLQGELAVEADADKGEVTVRPLKNSGIAALLLVTETVTVPVNARIVREGTGARSITIRVPAPQMPAAPAPRPAVKIAADHVRAIKDVIVAAATDHPEEAGYEVEYAGKVLPAVDALQVFHQMTITSATGLTARRYVVTNPTDQPVRIDERKLRTPDAWAVAVEHSELGPGDATVVVVVVPSGG